MRSGVGLRPTESHGMNTSSSTASSIAHSKVTFDWSDSKVNVAVVSSLGFGGHVRRVVSGNERTVQVWLSGVGSKPPAMFMARTCISCSTRRQPADLVRRLAGAVERAVERALERRGRLVAREREGGGDRPRRGRRTGVDRRRPDLRPSRRKAPESGRACRRRSSRGRAACAYRP